MDFTCRYNRSINCCHRDRVQSGSGPASRSPSHPQRGPGSSIYIPLPASCNVTTYARLRLQGTVSMLACRGCRPASQREIFENPSLYWGTDNSKLESWPLRSPGLGIATCTTIFNSFETRSTVIKYTWCRCGQDVPILGWSKYIHLTTIKGAV